jgi:hypothetical protein
MLSHLLLLMYNDYNDQFDQNYYLDQIILVFVLL